MKQNVILLSIDALRPDRLSCNRYHGIDPSQARRRKNEEIISYGYK